MDGKPTGAVRVSFGLMSTKKDATLLLEVLRNAFLQGNVVTHDYVLSCHLLTIA